MSLVTMNYEEAHAFVEKARIDVRWENYDLVFFKPTPFGFTNVSGAYRKGKWGMESRVTVSDDGTWKVPAKNVKTTR